MESNKGLTLKNIVSVLFPVLTVLLIQCIVQVADIIVVVITQLASSEKTIRTRSLGTILTEAYNQPMNQTYIVFARYALYIIVFGLWLRKLLAKEDFCSYKKAPSIPAIVILIIAGGLGQLFVDCDLALARPHFKKAFESYDSMTSTVTSANVSWLMLFTLFIVAPIAEEILFRGLITKYLHILFSDIKGKGSKALAIVFQAALFGIYHSNLIQGIYAFVMGLILGYLFFTFKSLIATMIFHVAINTSILFVPQNIFEETGTTVLFSIISTVLFIACIFILTKLNKKACAAKTE